MKLAHGQVEPGQFTGGCVDVCTGMMGFNARQAVGPELQRKTFKPEKFPPPGA